jgi:hypothetical protein
MIGVKFGSVALYNIVGLAELIWEVCGDDPKAADRASVREVASAVANVVARVKLNRYATNYIMPIKLSEYKTSQSQYHC